MQRLISARDIIQRDNQPTLKEWFRVTSIQLRLKGRALPAFNGTMSGSPVYAFVSNGRWLAVCDVPECRGCEYVDPNDPIFYCLTCGNGKSGASRPVKFPREWKQIEEALLKRAMMPVGEGDPILQTFNARPVDPTLRRDWAPKALMGHPALTGRVIVDEFDEPVESLRRRNMEAMREHL